MKVLLTSLLIITVLLFTQTQAFSQGVQSTIVADMIKSSTSATDLATIITEGEEGEADQEMTILNRYGSEERLFNGTLEKTIGSGITTKVTADSWARSKAEEAIANYVFSGEICDMQAVGSKTWSTQLTNESRLGVTIGGITADRNASGVGFDSFSVVHRVMGETDYSTFTHKAVATGKYERHDSVSDMRAVAGEAEEDDLLNLMDLCPGTWGEQMANWKDFVYPVAEEEILVE